MSDATDDTSPQTPPAPKKRKRRAVKAAPVETSPEAVTAAVIPEAPVEPAKPAEPTMAEVWPAPVEAAAPEQAETALPLDFLPLAPEPSPQAPLAWENAIGTMEDSDALPTAAVNSVSESAAGLAMESAFHREEHLASSIVSEAITHQMTAENRDEYPGELDPTQEPAVLGEMAQPSPSPAESSVIEFAKGLAEDLSDEVPPAAEAPEVSVTPEELERTVEALLFAAMEPISVREIARASESDSATIRKVIKALKETGERERRPWDLVEVAGAYRFVTRAEFHPAIQRLKTQTSQRKLTQAALETLALIAYRQPIGRAEIESVRGVNAGPVLRLLLEKKLIQISGRGTGVGQPLLYATTDYFLENFGLKNVNELPKPGEFKNA